MRIGYARVSTADQSLSMQMDALNKAGCDEIYQETASAKAKAPRPELDNLLRAIRAGDTLVIWRLDRLGRSMPAMVQLVEGLTAKGVQLESLSEKLDTSTATGKMFIGFIALMAEYERNLIAERTKAGLIASRQRGNKGGRRPKMTEKDIEQARILLSDPSQSVSEIARHFNISRSAFYNHVGAVKPHNKKATG